MERALSREALALALGEHERLPSPAELQRLLADAEINLFVQRPRLSDDALTTGWYLHGVASSPAAQQLYSRARQRQAFQVSAHILDLALQDPGRSRLDRSRLAFGAAVGYRRGELEPNAMAVYRRASAIFDGLNYELLERLPFVSMEVGITFLGFDTRALTTLTRRLKAQFAELRQLVEVDDLGLTIFGTVQRLVEGTDRLRAFLFAGAPQRLEEARELMRAATAPIDGVSDLDARWVSAHLLTLTDDAAGSSVWTGLPPDVPAPVKQAMVLTDPPVVTLWQPQRELFAAGTGRNVLSPDTRRVVMSLPTSAGKSLVAQLLALTHAASQLDSVCYVAPTQSLGREVRETLRNRLRIIRRELGPDLPDYYAQYVAEVVGDPQVDVMTPERLGHLMRNDLDAVLDRYGMFIFDEAHLLADPGRGFNLEWVLTVLHLRTVETRHRIVLLSAALGNRAEIVKSDVVV